LDAEDRIRTERPDAASPTADRNPSRSRDNQCPRRANPSWWASWAWTMSDRPARSCPATAHPVQLSESRMLAPLPLRCCETHRWRRWPHEVPEPPSTGANGPRRRGRGGWALSGRSHFLQGRAIRRDDCAQPVRSLLQGGGRAPARSPPFGVMAITCEAQAALRPALRPRHALRDAAQGYSSFQAGRTA